MTRIRWAAVRGTLTTALTDSDTTIEAAELAELPEISGGDIAAIIVDPAEVDGTAEVLYITAHDVDATTATVTRGEEQDHGASAPRAHANGMRWRHGATTTEWDQGEGQAAAALLAVASRMAFRGELDASTNPPLPSALNGDVWFVSGVGTVGGATAAQAGDWLVCKITTDPDAPRADGQAIHCDLNTSVNFTLGPDNDPISGLALTYTLVASPSNGAISGTGPFRQFTPDTDFSGTDRVLFICSDGVNTSNIAEVLIYCDVTLVPYRIPQPDVASGSFGEVGSEWAVNDLATRVAEALTTQADDIDADLTAGLADAIVTAGSYTDAQIAAVAAGFNDWKLSVRVASTTNLALTGSATINGVTPTNGDRVGAFGQTTPSQNGIYIYNSAGAWSRATDANTSAKVTSGMVVPVSEGSNGGALWLLITADPITLNTTGLTFTSVPMTVGIPYSYLSTDGTMAANSDVLVPSQKAVRTWVATQTGLLLPLSLADAKGDQFVATANDTVAKVSVGTNGYLWMADSAATAGVKWATPAQVKAALAVVAADLADFSQVTPNRQAASYTLVLTDIGKAVEMNVATANTCTVPPNSSVAVPINSVLEVGQYGAGQTTLTPGAGVTIRSEGGKLKIVGQYGTATLRKIGTDEWWAAGALTT